MFVGFPSSDDIRKTFPECLIINDQYIIPKPNDIRILSTFRR